MTVTNAKRNPVVKKGARIYSEECGAGTVVEISQRPELTGNDNYPRANGGKGGEIMGTVEVKLDNPGDLKTIYMGYAHPKGKFRSEFCLLKDAKIPAKVKNPKPTEITPAIVKALNVYFETVKLTTKSGKTLRIESDGRAGNGVSHWRAVIFNNKTIGDLVGDWKPGAEVTIRKGTKPLALGKRHEFKTLKAAAEFIVATF